MARQTYTGPLQWVVVDDGKQSVTCRHSQEYIKLPHEPVANQSFKKNYLAGLTAAKYDKILFIEDDDWYGPEYVEWQYNNLNRKELTGEGRARYYHLRLRHYYIHPNNKHASLSQTGIQRSLLPHVIDILEHDQRPECLDAGLWKRRRIEPNRKYLSPHSSHLVAIKAMPGAFGVGCHHNDAEVLTSGRYTSDPNCEQLRQWIGADTDFYMSLYSKTSGEVSSEPTGTVSVVVRSVEPLCCWW